jgi:hypothetical protein
MLGDGEGFESVGHFRLFPAKAGESQYMEPAISAKFVVVQR